MKTGTFTGFELELRDPGIAWFQFNSPERLNGMTTAIKRDLIEAITQAQMDNEVRVLVFTGTGRAPRKRPSRSSVSWEAATRPTR